jgi:hypothetical protein
MAFKFNPFTGTLDQTGSGGGASYIDGEVQNFSALPETIGTPAVDSAYLVREAEGTWLLARKPAGIYIRTADTGVRAADWTHASAFPDVFSDAAFTVFSDGDSTKNLQLSLSGITTGTVRTLTAPDASGTIQLTGHAAEHATGGSDAVSAFSIGAESIFDATGNTLSGTPVTLAASRARVWTLICFSSTTVTLPTTGVELGDRIVLRGGSPVSATISISSTGVADTIQNADEQFSYTYLSTGIGNRWIKNLVDNHDAARVNSGTFNNARINFAAPPAIGSTTPNTGAFTTLSANNGTLTASAPVLDLAQTWNNAAVLFTGAQIAITDTASNTDSELLTLKRNATTVFRFRKSGQIVAASTMTLTATGGNVIVNGNLNIGSSNLTLAQDAADTLAQRRSTNPQTFRIYTTYGGTGGADFERLFIKGQTLGAFQIGTEKGGTGSARALEFQTDGTTRVTILSTGQMGIGTTNPNRSLHISDAAAMGRIDRIGGNGPAFLMTRMAVLGTVTSSWLFGPATGFASVANDDFSIIDFGTAVGGVSGTQRLTIAKSDGQLTVNGNLNLATKDLVTDTTTGTKIGTATTQKIGFFGATPVVQQAAVADATDAATAITQLNDLLAAMRTLGLIAT